MTTSSSTPANKIFAIADKVKDCTSDDPFIAFEYYPPRSESGVIALEKRMQRMKQLGPMYVDFTWGAGGTTSDLTIDLCVKAQEKFGYVANMHLTCTNMPKEKVDMALKISTVKNIRNILALRGDPPVGQVDWKPVDSGFSCALDLVKYIKEYEARENLQGFFSITVAAYPEGHPNRINKFATLSNDEDVPDLSAYDLSDSEKLRVVQIGRDLLVCRDEDFAEEMKYLKEKVDAGASMIVTQMFYDADVFLAFVESCKAYGINVPVVPGIMLVTNYKGFKKMNALCKTRCPPEVQAAFEKAKDFNEEMKKAGIKVATKICKKLLASGVSGLHFYTLNLDDAVVGVLHKLDLFTQEYAQVTEIQETVG